MSETAQATSTILKELALAPGRYVVATIHRPQNTDVPDRLRAIFEAFIALGETLVLPLHPRTVKELQRADLYDRVAAAPHILLTKPLNYIDFLRLKMDARLVITDSGGVQKEAYFCQRPCVTIFPNTAWVETVEDGWNVVVDADREEILHAARTFQPAHSQRNVFGDGHSGEKIVELILDYLAHPRPIYKIV
jgi:UDP-N-acetylglucosamine 2-epimerase (non-hydrolysing)